MKYKIINIFKKFKIQNVQYCYIRDRESFESIFQSDGSDIDLIVDYNQMNVITLILNQNDFFRLFSHKSFLHLKHNIFFDLHSKTYERFPQLNISRALLRRVEKEFYFLDDVDLYKILLLHPMDLTGFRGQRIYTENKIKYLKNNKNIDKIKDELIEEFGFTFTNKLIKNIKNSSFDLIKKDNFYFKVLMYLHRPKTLKYLFQRVKRKLFKLKYQKAKLIIFMGVDGSGKTTAAENTIEFMKRYYGVKSNKIKYFYLGSQGGYILPIVRIAEFKNKIMSFFKKVEEKKINRSKENFAISMTHSKLKEIILIFEYILRYVKIFYLMRIKNKIVISDRYLYDHFRTNTIDPKVVKFFSKLFPKPDYIFMMKGDTKKFFDRKKEYSPDILKIHQNDLINGLKELNYNFIEVDANKNQDDVLKEILKVLSD